MSLRIKWRIELLSGTFLVFYDTNFQLLFFFKFMSTIRNARENIHLPET